MVSFDLAVVAANDSSNAPITYNRANNTCTLKCHNFNHNADGTVQARGGLSPPVRHELNSNSAGSLYNSPRLLIPPYLALQRAVEARQMADHTGILL